MAVTREEWAAEFLDRARWPVSYKNLVAMVAWIAAEGSPDNPPQSAPS